jgi:hypothetical protein
VSVELALIENFAEGRHRSEFTETTFFTKSIKFSLETADRLCRDNILRQLIPQIDNSVSQHVSPRASLYYLTISLFQLHTVASSYWSSRFVSGQDLRDVAVVHSMLIFEDFRQNKIIMP